MKTFTMILALSGFLHADELVLKDGRKVEWKTISDAGDSYEIETSTGAKVSVKKSEVERFTTVDRQSPLTGASITFDKKLKLSAVDLLEKADPKRDGLTGIWKMAGGRLSGQGAVNAIAKFQVGVPLPEEYDLELQVVRKDGNDELAVGLVGGGRQFMIQFDAMSSTVSGPISSDGVGASTNGMGVPGKFFVNGQPKSITIMVRKDALVVRTEKDFIAIRADWAKLGIHPAYGVLRKDAAFIALGTSAFQIMRFSVMSPK